jgi:hypothetical protein
MKRESVVKFLLRSLGDKFPTQMQNVYASNREVFNDICIEAEKMEEMYIVDAFDDGFEEMPYKNGEHYYNENYKSE